ncbi:MAG: hypothetical protein HYZ11_10410 [Candidatus Tectomicrobia bacterium]|uniref:Uncharacterized protein n=1 Tax=Tectimicrobiota bacterium TaxID=2528274 RepID=A0A932MM86_UNCTE|nr:hypothetical protein [Candidatus Tectomicrobia bacterium]
MAEQFAIWVCPNCNRTFREHVFGEGTSMSGPTCNSCCVALVPPHALEGEEEAYSEQKEERAGVVAREF